MSISSQLQAIREKIPPKVKLVAVSKTKPVELIIEAYEAGQRTFGENRVQEMVEKWKVLPRDIEWHMIGHLQSNKVKQIAPFVSMIQAVDSEKLLGVINDQALKNQRRIDVLLQFHIAKESSKYGLSMHQAVELLSGPSFAQMSNVNVRGVMGMATFTNDHEQVRIEFNSLKRIFEEIKLKCFADKPDFDQISMGMSGDFELAIEEGATMVRVGSGIFGERH